MPAVGKCRKGVFRMKKLLLVMLVPVLVLGVMGCGAKLPDGGANPIMLQGYWTTSGTEDVDLVISGNQITLINPSASTYLGNIALRTNYDGEKGENESGFLAVGDEFTITFNWFDDPYKEVGKVTAKVTGINIGAETFEVTEVQYAAYYQNVMLPQKTAAYTKVGG
jgi:hypothetical protein